MTAARKLADHVAVIRQGRIVGSGDAESLLGADKPLVHQLLSGELSGPVQLGAR